MALSQKAATLQLVRRLINRDSEDKQVAWEPERNVSHNSAIGTADPVPVLGQIKEGTDAQQRIGDRIKPKSLVVRGVISIASNKFNTSQNLYARIVIASQKTIKVGSAIPGSVDVANLLHAGFDSAPSQQFTGNTAELSYPINKALFRRYMDKIVELSPVYTLTANQSVSPTPTTTFRWSYTFKSDKLPANFQFDDVNGDWVNNFAPFVAIGYAYADGTAPDVVDQKIVSSVYTSLTYEDA